MRVSAPITLEPGPDCLLLPLYLGPGCAVYLRRQSQALRNRPRAWSREKPPTEKKKTDIEGNRVSPWNPAGDSIVTLPDTRRTHYNPSSRRCYANLDAYRITRSLVCPLRCWKPHSAKHTAKRRSSWSLSRQGSKAMLPVAMLVVRR
jgi:hypothetical protein